MLAIILDDTLLKFSWNQGCKDHMEKSKAQSQLEIHGEVISQEDANLKLLRSLPSAWNSIALIMRNKSDLDTLSMDDLYNNLKPEKGITVKLAQDDINIPGSSSSSSSILKVVVSTAKGKRENVVKSSACWIWRPTGKVINHISKDSGSYMPKRFNYVDPQGRLNGCSRHMIGNKSYLTDYQDIDGGFVAFVGSLKVGKITRKGKIRTEKLDFEDVYFVKELKFNLFFILQMYDKKNSVLFTKTECLVLSPDFKLLDESQVLLKVPRQNNMFSWVFFLATKDETCGILKTCITGIENQINHNVKIIKCDNGTEFKNNDTNQLCRMKGIKREFNVARIPQKNEVAERNNRTLIEAARTMLADSLLHTTFWAEAVSSDCYVKNRVLVTKSHNKTPYELLHGRLPSISFIRPFRYPVTILNTLDPIGKFDRKADEGFLVGYSINSKAFRVFNTRTRKVEENLHITFLENKPNVAGSIETNVNAWQVGQEKASDHEYILLPLMLSNSPLSSTLTEIVIIFSGVYDDEDVGAKADLNNMETTMNVWTLVDLPKGKMAIRTKWVYRNKKDERGIVVRNKARLVAQSYTQEEGIDYDEVFAPISRIESIRLFLAYALFIGLIVYHMDVNSALLYGTIEEEVYVCQPPGFEDPQFPDKVYKVEKTLYSLHQAPRAWYETLSTYLLENGYRRGTIDKTLFIKKDKGEILLVQVYVDDIIFGSTKNSLCVEFEQMMHKKFQMSSIGELTFLLGLQVMQKDDGIFISQDRYVADILKKFDFVMVKTTSTPIETNKALLKDEEAEDVDVHLYRSMIGSLMYLTASRPDIIYLKGQPKLGLWYPRDSPFDLEAFSDSDYAGASLDRKSTTGGVMDPKSNA
ncbi:retrovirus-related pol polyprotein from transposon TNT 1-94 [Tanacetum coccineum]